MVASVYKSLTFLHSLEIVMSFDKEQPWFNSIPILDSQSPEGGEETAMQVPG